MKFVAKMINWTLTINPGNCRLIAYDYMEVFKYRKFHKDSGDSLDIICTNYYYPRNIKYIVYCLGRVKISFRNKTLLDRLILCTFF